MIRIDLNKQLKGSGGTYMLRLKQEFEQGQFVCFYGKSGSGKTSFIRMIAGLMRPDSGSLQVHDSLWFHQEKKIDIPPNLRSTSLAFQHYALLPHLTVRQNLEFALNKGEDDTRLLRFAKIGELTKLFRHFPNHLSGGQRQRVALIRALLRRAQILLLDEPLSALDYEMRLRMQTLIEEEVNNSGQSVFMVSHDPAEIVRLSNHLIVIEEGEAIYSGLPLKYFEEESTNNQQIRGTIIHINRDCTPISLRVLVGDRVLVLNAADEQSHFVGQQIELLANSIKPL